MRLSIALALAAVLLGGRGGRVSARTEAEPHPPVHTVRIDAIAFDTRGDVVGNLAAGDFDLREDDVPRAIESVQFGRPSGRLFAIFLDEYHVTSGAATARARQALTRFVDEELAPDDLVVVMKPLDSLFEIRPTRDRASARRAIATFEGRKGDYTPRNAYEKNFVAGDPARIEAARLQVAISAINALAVELGRMDDTRKTVIVVTETLGRTVRTRGREYLATLDTVIRSANKSSVSIYAVDPREGPPGDAADAAEAAGREAVRTMTADTDGQAVAAADLATAMRKVARDSSGYYLLTYRAPHLEDGAFHPVSVRVKRPGVQVRARAGYWAPSPDDALRASVVVRARQPEPAPRVEIRHVSPLIRPWFGLSRGEMGKTRVTFVWEAATRVPGDRIARAPSRVVLTALATGEAEAVIFEGTVLPTGATAIEEGGAAARAVFDAPPGTVRLRMKIEDEAAQVMDSDVRDLVVRDWLAAVAIGTPEVLRARSAREFRSLDADPDAAPVVSREFSRTERLLVRFAAYAPEGARPTVTARLLGRSGDALRELKVEAAGTSEGRKVDVPLASLAPGEYAIELAAASSAGQAKDRFVFRVTN